MISLSVLHWVIDGHIFVQQFFYLFWGLVIFFGSLLSFLAFLFGGRVGFDLFLLSGVMGLSSFLACGRCSHRT